MVIKVKKLNGLKTLDEMPIVNYSWIVPNCIRERTITQFFGISGVGKSTLILSIIKYALDSSKIEQVIYLDCDNCENDEIIAFSKRYQERLHYYFDYDPKRFKDDFGAYDDLKGVLFVFDGIINFIENSKLNNDESVNKFMQMLRDLRAKGATVMYLNHTAKHNDSSAKGNNQLENYSDENFKVTRDYDIITLAPKKYRIRGIKSTRLQIDIDTFEIKSICYDDKLFGLSDDEKMTLKMCVEILDQNESGLNQKELTNKLYKIKDENHFEIVGKNKLWTLLKSFEKNLFNINKGPNPNEKIYKLLNDEKAKTLKENILAFDDC
ncbi:AAA family ATPase [Campylobacter sp.]|uniref:AAA family ATPase n=1 Tax=Campylobacter sp. TaxID=205 RepID=UPI002A58C667|nr:AAA family ATPase [Campylobacter sp.]MDD7090110.1 hypothetical protein [Campylobacteraceae bacterium]MDY5285072.1 AAA family ATPase [Campylobacter sp.]